MIATVCQHEHRRTNGKTKAGAIRFRCKSCGRSWTESTSDLDGMRIGMDRATKIIELLCEGMSVRATARLMGANTRTVLDLMVMVGEKCEKYMQENIKGVFVGDLQVDEIWSYVLCKNATAKREKMVGGCGDNTIASRPSTVRLSCWSLGIWAAAPKSTPNNSSPSWTPPRSVTSISAATAGEAIPQKSKSSLATGWTTA